MSLGTLESPVVTSEVEETENKTIEQVREELANLLKEYDRIFGNYDTMTKRYIAFQQKDRSEPSEYQEESLVKMSYSYDDDKSMNDLKELCERVRQEIQFIENSTERMNSTIQGIDNLESEN